MKNIRPILSVILLVSLLFLVSACSSESTDETSGATKNAENEETSAAESEESDKYQDGVYTASASGKNGKVEVTVTIEDGAISQIEIGDNQETPRYAEKVFSELPERIIKAQSIDVDTVTGATATSNAVLRAVMDCLEQAS